MESPGRRPVGQNPLQQPGRQEAETGPSLDPDGTDGPALSRDTSVTAVLIS